jgi:hypothetical protein
MSDPRLVAINEMGRRRLNGEPLLTADAFEEGKHPRADNGQFGSGGGGTSIPHVGPKAPNRFDTKAAGAAYRTARTTATSASAKAKQSGNKQDHSVAAKAHSEAGHAARAAGDAGAASSHEKETVYHRKMATAGRGAFT